MMALDTSERIRRFLEIDAAPTEETHAERLELQRWLSENLSSFEVPLNRLTRTQSSYDPERVGYYEKCNTHLPVVVITGHPEPGYYFLRDGPHRYVAAIRQSKTTIQAVCAVE